MKYSDYIVAKRKETLAIKVSDIGWKYKKFDKVNIYSCPMLYIGIISVSENLKREVWESRFMDISGTLWVSKDGFDIRTELNLSIENAIELIKDISISKYESLKSF